MDPNQEGRAPMAFPARFAGIFFSPSGVFQELARRPTWLAPLLVVILVITTQQVVIWFSDTGVAAMRQELQDRMPASAPPEALDRQIAITRYAAPIGTLVVGPVITLIFAGLVYLLFSVVLGGEGTFKQTFSSYTHVSLIGVPQAVVATAMIFLRGNAKSSTALSAFLPFLEEKSFAYRFSQGLDIFVLWQFAILSIGMGIINKITTQKAATVIFSTYLVLWLGFCVVRQALF